jgi:cytidine deaminase
MRFSRAGQPDCPEWRSATSPERRLKTREEKDLDIEELATCAHEAMGRAYAPYSKFRVGAALETQDGRVFGGCNVENASYPVTVCAERVALGAAVVAGATRFRRILICSSGADPVTPCGMCRQALSEFGVDLEVICEGMSGSRQSWALSELLPGHFGPEELL